ncbi:sulfatase-like hydrolase/transferase [Rubinisphaera italica]|nr:sulfatase-like hydrolase/transferase [Rubinisphaera italica]
MIIGENSLREKRALTPGKKVERTPTGHLPRDKPNIVLIFADDLGIEAFNACGGRGVRTPHLDKLATTNVTFENATRKDLLWALSHPTSIIGSDAFPAISKQDGSFARDWDTPFDSGRDSLVFLNGKQSFKSAF